MITVLGRAMNGNIVEGYIVQDTNTLQTGMINKKELWLQARNKEVNNVEASGSMINLVLTGTNGFQLKSLPVIKANTKMDKEDVLACYLRSLLSGKINASLKFNEFVNISEQYIKDERDKGILSDYNKGILSNSIRVINTLGDIRNSGAIIDSSMCKYVDTSSDNSTSLIVGYAIQNVGDIAIPITRITATPDHTQSIVMLGVGQKIAISTAEMALLASKPEIGCKFKNAKLTPSVRVLAENEIYERLHTCVLHIKDINVDGASAEILNMHDRRLKIRVDKVATQEEMSKYFVINYDNLTSDRVQLEGPAQSQAKTQSNTVNKLKNSKGAKGLFNAFKR